MECLTKMPAHIGPLIAIIDIPNNVAVTNSKDIANGFVDFFVSIGPELAKDIHSDINPLTYVRHEIRFW